MKQEKLNYGPLLDEHGHLVQAGYANELVKSYSRNQIGVKGLRIKEWDYYFTGNEKYGFAVTVADNDYMSLVSVTFFDFLLKKEITKTKMGFLSRGKLNMPNSSIVGNVIFKKKGFEIYYLIEDKTRHIIVHVDQFRDQEKLIADLYLTPTIKDSMVIATPFNKPKHFYYNQKINLLHTKGNVTIGENVIDFNDSYGVLDWGRGVWTYKNTWYWSSLSGIYQNQKIGFNLGYGFGDTSKATENMLFLDDQTYKFADVTFEIPKKNGKDDFMSPWKIVSKNKDIDLVFEPILDRFSNTNIGIIASNQHQVFGYFSGVFHTKDKDIEIKKMLGFAEKVMNRW